MKSDWGSVIKPNKAKALALSKREVSVYVHDAVALEGIHFTLPEVQTLLEGVTVGGHKLSDQQIAVNQGNAWRMLFDWVATGDFNLSESKILKLHTVAAKEEALEWGCFRSGGVTIAGSVYLPPLADKLAALYAEFVASLESINDIYDRAIHAFLHMARCQFFYDVNKRMGRFVMNGILLSAGYPAINLPASKKLEFNTLMLEFYTSGDELPMNTFMRGCVDERFVTIMNEA